ncbi:MAG: asparaginase domain-containing protein [Pirellulales bacterium]|nr:asparaginase domain-containing protein [Pirellulales bacterium]
MKLKILTTGGTIDKQYFDATSEFQVGDAQIGEFLREASVTFDYEVESICRKDSLELTDEDRARVRAAIEDDAQHQRFLITHGTDTMVQTAKRLLDIPDKTIVLTGSMNPARLRVSDAGFNIGFAVAACETLPPGVYITMNGRIFDPHNVRKNHQQHCFETISG